MSMDHIIWRALLRLRATRPNPPGQSCEIKFVQHKCIPESFVRIWTPGTANICKGQFSLRSVEPGQKNDLSRLSLLLFRDG